MKKVLIIFPDSHLAYSPTTLQLQAELNKQHTCEIFCFGTADYYKLTDKKIIYPKRLFGIGRIIQITKFIFPFLLKQTTEFYYRRCQLWYHLILNKYDEYIYVDPISIAYAGMFYKKGTLLSLELTHNTLQFLKCLKKPIKNIIIQSKERLNTYFSDINAKVFFIQNAPIFDEKIMPFLKEKKEKQLVFGGTASFHFGIIPCIQFILNNESYSLKIKGNIPRETQELIDKEYHHLIQSNRLIIQNNYESDYDYQIDLSENYIGFAFYDFSYKEIDNINYKTGPSGKMFKCFSAGVPIIANNIPGFNPVSEFKAGILIDNLNDVNILKAINTISNNYSFYRDNCFKAAKHYSFDKTSEAFVKSIEQN